MNPRIGRFLLWRQNAVCCLLYAAAATHSPAQTLTTLASFDGSNGSLPYATLLQATDGYLYGTTVNGGIGDGTVFRISTGGALTAVYTFTNSGDGANPVNPLIQGTDGNFYGTTGDTAFSLAPGGAITVLYEFSNPADGSYPGPLVQATNGNFYATTSHGGRSNFADCGTTQCGTVFIMSPSGAFADIHRFSGPDGADPEALTYAFDGDFYGTTAAGGPARAGTVFKITPAGTFTTLYSFMDEFDGYDPGTLVQASDGDFYGMTSGGGTIGAGSVFKISPNGTLITLYSFTGNVEPSAALIQATDGNFYGTTLVGGPVSQPDCPGGCGTIFKMTPSGTLTTLYTFSGTDGSGPNGLIQDTDGKFYGTTISGGTSMACSFGCGTVFSLSVGLRPFLKTIPAMGSVGASVEILGTDLTGATGVTFDGATAAFTIVSATEITTTVPAGATSGKVRVVTPAGALVSNVAFRVRP